MEQVNPFKAAEIEWKKSSINQAFVNTLGQLYVKRYPSLSIRSDSATALQKSIYEGADDVHAFNADGVRQTIIERIKHSEGRGLIRPWYTQVTFWAEHTNMLRSVPEEDLHFLLLGSLQLKPEDVDKSIDLDVRESIQKFLDPRIPKNPDGSPIEFELQKVIRDQISLYARPLIELYGCLKTIPSLCFPLGSDDVQQIINMFFDSQILDSFFRKRFIPYDEESKEKKTFPLIGEGHTYQRMHGNFVLKYLGMESEEFFQHRLMFLWLYALYSDDPMSKQFFEKEAFSLIPKLDQWAKVHGKGDRIYGNQQLILETIQYLKYVSSSQVFLFKIRQDYAKKSLFSSYISELRQILFLQGQVVSTINSLNLPFPVDTSKHTQQSLLRQFALNAIESELDKLIDQIPIPKGHKNVKMILVKRVANLRKNVAPLNVMNDLITSFVSIGRLIESYDTAFQEIISEMQQIHMVMLQRSKTYFEEMAQEIEAQKRERDFKDQSEEFKSKIDSPSILARQYGNEAKRHIRSVQGVDEDNILDYYTMILTMKSTEIMFDDASTGFMRKKRIWNSMFEEYYTPLLKVLEYRQKHLEKTDQSQRTPESKRIQKSSFSSTAEFEKVLLETLDETSLNFLFSQLDIMRKARNLPKTNVDEPLVTGRFFNSLELIEDWIAPMAGIFTILEEEEQLLRDLQNETRYAIQESDKKKWKEIIAQPHLNKLLQSIQILYEGIIKKRLELIEIANHSKISEALGLALFPYSGHKTLDEAIIYAEKKYYGHNIRYQKRHRFIDALIFDLATRNIIQKKDTELMDTDTRVQVNYDKYLDLVTNLKDVYMEAQASNFQFKGFNMRQIDSLVSRTINRRLTSDERSMLYNDPYYLEALDQIRCDLFMAWLDSQYRGVDQQSSSSSTVQKESIDKYEGSEPYIFGISFLDKHVYSGILGNIDFNLEQLISQIFAPFTNLKQEETFVESAQFEIDIPDVPNQAWIYDFTGINSHILRSTMFLISNRQPKFDLLEYSQTIVNSILSGRVERNDQKSSYNYIYTDLLPKETWNHIGTALIQILIEVLIHENPRARKIIRKVFMDEDRSNLISSKQFVPMYYLETDWQVFKFSVAHKEVPIPTIQRMSIYTRPGFDFEFRHIEAGGYPWYYKENNILQGIIKESYKVSRHLNPNDVKLKRIIYNISDEKFIFYFKASEDQARLQILAFKEEENAGEEGISPVEVLFRPKKFIERSPEKNNLVLLVDNARATDPQDLKVLIESITAKVKASQENSSVSLENSSMESESESEPEPESRLMEEIDPDSIESESETEINDQKPKNTIEIDGQSIESKEERIPTEISKLRQKRDSKTEVEVISKSEVERKPEIDSEFEEKDQFKLEVNETRIKRKFEIEHDYKFTDDAENEELDKQEPESNRIIEVEQEKEPTVEDIPEIEANIDIDIKAELSEDDEAQIDSESVEEEEKNSQSETLESELESETKDDNVSDADNKNEG